MTTLSDYVLLLMITPVIGSVVLTVAGSILKVCERPATPRWQVYAWYAVVGFAVMNWSAIAGALRAS